MVRSEGLLLIASDDGQKAIKPSGCSRQKLFEFCENKVYIAKAVRGVWQLGGMQDRREITLVGNSGDTH